MQKQNFRVHADQSGGVPVNPGDRRFFVLAKKEKPPASGALQSAIRICRSGERFQSFFTRVIMLKNRDQAGDRQNRLDLGDIRQDQPPAGVLDRCQ